MAGALVFYYTPGGEPQSLRHTKVDPLDSLTHHWIALFAILTSLTRNNDELVTFKSAREFQDLSSPKKDRWSLWS